jgi:thiol-disulfide isomerase/thioredoxin
MSTTFALMKQYRVFFLFVTMIACLEFAQGQTTLDTAVNFNVKDIHGNKYILFDILDSGKFVVLDFFSTSCGPCVTYAPDMQQAYSHYGSNQNNVIFIGMAWDPTNASVAAFDSANSISYPTVSGQGYSYQVITAYNSQSFPTTFIIAPNRVILTKQIWPPSFNNIDSVLSASLLSASVDESIESKEITWIGVYPNPVVSDLTCNLYFPVHTSLGFDVYNCFGERVFTAAPAYYARGNQSLIIPAGQFSAGMYFVKFNSDTGNMNTFKFVRK